MVIVTAMQGYRMGKILIFNCVTQRRQQYVNLTFRVGHRLLDTMKKFTRVDIRHECTITSMIAHEQSEWSIMLKIVHEWRISTRVNF